MKLKEIINREKIEQVLASYLPYADYVQTTNEILSLEVDWEKIDE